jgi:predicted DNA-binding protein
MGKDDKFSIRVPIEFRERIEKLSDKLGYAIPISDFTNQAISNELERMESKILNQDIKDHFILKILFHLVMAHEHPSHVIPIKLIEEFSNFYRKMEN